MYYSSGNYEAFARTRKPEGVNNKASLRGGVASPPYIWRDKDVIYKSTEKSNSAYCFWLLGEKSGRKCSETDVLGG